MTSLKFDPVKLVQSAIAHGAGISFPKPPMQPDPGDQLERTRAYHRNFKRRWREARRAQGKPV
jgi:hypothetical protein